MGRGERSLLTDSGRKMKGSLGFSGAADSPDIHGLDMLL